MGFEIREQFKQVSGESLLNDDDDDNESSEEDAQNVEVN